MDKLYSARGISFRYPSDWELTEDQRDRDISVSVTGPRTSFWTLTLLADRPEAERVLEEVLNTFRDEYQDIDEYPATAVIQNAPCVARDLQFFQYELVNSAFVRVFPVGSKTACLLYQGNDQELAETRSLLEAITASLSIDPDL